VKKQHWETLRREWENKLDVNLHSHIAAAVVSTTISSTYKVISVLNRGRRDPFNKACVTINSRYHITDKSDQL